MDGVDAELTGQRGSGGVVVTGEHRDVVAAAAQLVDDLTGFRAQFVAHRDRTQQGAIVLDEDHGRPGGLHAGDLLGQRSRIQPAGPPQPQDAAVLVADQGRPSHRSHVAGGLDSVGGLQYRSGRGVFAADFQSRRGVQHLAAGGTFGGGDVDDGGPVGGQGAGLVQRHRAHRPQRLQRGPALDNPEPASCRDPAGC
jgi:hypothetical protein